MKASSSLITSKAADTLIIKKQGPVWGVLAVLGVYLYFANYLMRKTKPTSWQIAKHVLSFNIFTVGMMTLFYLTFMATTIAVTLFQQLPKELPFQTFDQMADAVLDGRIKIVGLDGAAPSNSKTIKQ